MQVSWRLEHVPQRHHFFAVKLNCPRESTEAEHHYVASRMCERKLDPNAKKNTTCKFGEHDASMCFCAGKRQTCRVKENRRILKRKRLLVLGFQPMLPSFACLPVFLAIGCVLCWFFRCVDCGLRLCLIFFLEKKAAEVCLQVRDRGGPRRYVLVLRSPASRQ